MKQRRGQALILFIILLFMLFVIFSALMPDLFGLVNYVSNFPIDPIYTLPFKLLPAGIVLMLIGLIIFYAQGQ